MRKRIDSLLNPAHTLFSKGELAFAMAGQLKAIILDVAALTQEQLSATGIETLVKQLVSKRQLVPLSIGQGFDVEGPVQIQVDATGDPAYFKRGGSGSRSATADRYTYFVAFTGEPTLWDLKPIETAVGYPFGYIDVSKKALVIEIEFPMATAKANYTKVFNDQLRYVDCYIEAQRQQLKPHPEALATQARTAVERRLTALLPV